MFPLEAASAVNFRSGSAWLNVAPFAMRKTLNWIKSHYGDVPVYVTANAFSDTTGDLNDTNRVDYHNEYTNEMLKGNGFILQCSFVLSQAHKVIDKK